MVRASTTAWVMVRRVGCFSWHLARPLCAIRTASVMRPWEPMVKTKPFHVPVCQRAMGYARRHPEPGKGGRGKKGAASGEFSGVSHQRVSEAREVLQYSREITERRQHDHRGKPSGGIYRNNKRYPAGR